MVRLTKFGIELTIYLKIFIAIAMIIFSNWLVITKSSEIKIQMKIILILFGNIFPVIFIFILNYTTSILYIKEDKIIVKRLLRKAYFDFFLKDVKEVSYKSFPINRVKIRLSDHKVVFSILSKSKYDYLKQESLKRS